jgi:tetratricopeptide (TPR) repeat protein
MLLWLAIASRQLIGDEQAAPERPTPGQSHAANQPLTFRQHIAPLVLAHCAQCHRPGQSGPFSLLTYDDVRKRADQIAEVTRSRFMPPYLPDTSVVHYENERVLTDGQIAAFGRWAAQGAPEGDAADAVDPPRFVEGWHLGTPDLVATMPQPFEMPATGPDIYRNFVVPVALDRPRWVRAMEFRPGNYRIVHHAFMMIDSTGAARRYDREDALPGYPGMDVRGAVSPEGQFVGWQPGRLPSVPPDGIAWRITPGTDLVLQVHMQATGKPEPIQASVGFFFTDQPPTKHPFKLVLRSIDIDIPAGEANYTFEQSYTLPVDVEALAVTAHAHYLGKKMHVWGELPDGKRQWLLKIDDWDLNWQGDYRYRDPLRLPKGTRIVQRYTYDNSSKNIRNPSRPPRRVQYGLEATDEMGSVWLQLLPRSAEQLHQLRLHYGRYVMQDIYHRSRKILQQNPADVSAHVELGKIAMATGRMDVATAMFRKAAALDPNSLLARFHLGDILLRQSQWAEGEREIQAALAIDPQDFKALYDLGMMHLQQDHWGEALDYFQQALTQNAFDPDANQNVAVILIRQGTPDRAIPYLERVLDVHPDDPEILGMLRSAKQSGQGSRVGSGKLDP